MITTQHMEQIQRDKFNRKSLLLIELIIELVIEHIVIP